MLPAMKNATRHAVIALLATAVAANASAQPLASRVDAAPPGYVQFSFAARAGVCGNGTSWIQTSPGNFSGTFTGSIGETLRTQACEPGPVRVLLDRADRTIIAIRTYVGPGTSMPAGTDLGRVTPQQGVDYLLGLAGSAEGRVGRDAIQPATLADSVRIGAGLLAIARNRDLPRETRTTALGALSRSADAPDPADLLALARDETDNLQVRTQALSALGRLEHGAGLPLLSGLASQTGSLWLAKEAMDVVAASGDPRAREYLRSAVQQGNLSDEALAVAIRALGRQYATRRDSELLRSLYPRLTTDASREAVLNAMADAGGSESVTWLLQLARNEDENPARRRRAVDNASRAGAPIADLVALYDGVTDQQLKLSLITVYARSGERAALDKLLSIAQTETNVNVRRRAISSLSDSSDPRVREVLRQIIIRS
jgi:HEAT repeat protein